MNVELAFRDTQRLRGGWNVSPDEYRQMGYTPGLPPGLPGTKTSQVQVLSNIFEAGGLISQYPEGISCQIYNKRSVVIWNSPEDSPSIVVANYLVDSLIARGAISSEFKPIINTFPDTSIFVLVFPTEEDTQSVLSQTFKISFKGIALDIRPFQKPSDLPLPPINLISQHPRRVIAMNVDTEAAQFDLFLSQFFKIDGFLILPNIKDCVLFDVCPPIAPEAAALIIDGVQFGETRIIARALRSVVPRKDIEKYGEFSVLCDGVNLQQIIQPRTQITTASDTLLSSGKKLHILNVVPISALSDREESQILIYDIAGECKKYGNVVECKLTNESKFGSCGGYGVAIVTFQKEEAAALAQQHLAGRRYLGRVVITMLCE
ncbi:splicing factor u2af large subunit [Histomonas meleagridis]|uniref:splicing factor u2af large subunit n=1 Tax=Histomonas meleagridis TaxID=135588 RepID=UPI003559F01B|nr:splicing factor u2af large subunit [Histomonas meleagridis]KAH0804513.1 splicing factor u2af large subunit [Histomonas meleagridis]